MTTIEKLKEVLRFLDTIIPEEDLEYIQGLTREAIDELSEESPSTTEQGSG